MGKMQLRYNLFAFFAFCPPILDYQSVISPLIFFRKNMAPKITARLFGLLTADK